MIPMTTPTTTTAADLARIDDPLAWPLPRLLEGREMAELTRLLLAGATLTVACRALPTTRRRRRSGFIDYLPAVAWLDWYNLGPVYEIPLTLLERLFACHALTPLEESRYSARGSLKTARYTLSPLGRVALAVGARERGDADAETVAAFVRP